MQEETLISKEDESNRRPMIVTLWKWNAQRSRWTRKIRTPSGKKLNVGLDAMELEMLGMSGPTAKSTSEQLSEAHESDLILAEMADRSKFTF
jgi:hypothetical protein